MLLSTCTSPSPLLLHLSRPLSALLWHFGIFPHLVIQTFRPALTYSILNPPQGCLLKHKPACITSFKKNYCIFSITIYPPYTPSHLHPPRPPILLLINIHEIFPMGHQKCKPLKMTQGMFHTASTLSSALNS